MLMFSEFILLKYSNESFCCVKAILLLNIILSYKKCFLKSTFFFLPFSLFLSRFSLRSWMTSAEVYFTHKIPSLSILLFPLFQLQRALFSYHAAFFLLSTFFLSSPLYNIWDREKKTQRPLLKSIDALACCMINRKFTEENSSTKHWLKV